jgi:hypothetical protein
MHVRNGPGLIGPLNRDLQGPLSLRVGCIIHEILDMWKVSAKWVSKCLKAATSFTAYLDRFCRDHVGLLNRLITMDETWNDIFDQETKQQPKEWREWVAEFKELQDKEVVKQGVCVCLLRERWNFASRIRGIVCNHHGTVLGCTSRKTEAAAVSQHRDKLSRNLVSSKQSSCTQGRHYAPQIGIPSLHSSAPLSSLTRFGPFKLLSLF